LIPKFCRILNVVCFLLGASAASVVYEVVSKIFQEVIGETQTLMGDNIKMDLQEYGVGCGYWIESVQDRGKWRALVSTVKNLRFP
jgi:hypothetical protein